MVVARCTLSDCSELFRSLLLAVCLTAGAPVRADSWSEGRFPIPVFEGYTSHFGMRRAADGTLYPTTGWTLPPLGVPCSELVTRQGDRNHRRLLLWDWSCDCFRQVPTHLLPSASAETASKSVGERRTGHWSGRPDRSHHRSASSLGNPSLRSLARPCRDPQGHDPRPTGNRPCRPLIFRVKPDQLP